MIEVKVSPFGSAVALDPARRVPRNDQPATLAVLGGCRPGHDLDPRQVRPGCLLFRPRPVGFVPLPERQPPPIFRRQDRILAGVARPQLQPPVLRGCGMRGSYPETTPPNAPRCTLGTWGPNPLQLFGLITI